MKVGIVTTWLQRCGIATYSGFLGEKLLWDGVKTTILAERRSVLPKGFDPDFPFSVPYNECWSRHENFDELTKAVKELKIDVVHIQHQFGLFPYEATLTELLKNLKGLGVTVVVTLHDVTGFNPQMETYFGNIIKYSDKIIVHTELCHQLMARVWKCPPKKLVHIYHGTKLIKVPNKKPARSKLGLPLDAKIILSWGFIWESKGIKELVEILAELLKTYPNAILIHAGGLHPVFKRDSYLKGLFKKAFQLGVRPDSFKVTGFINEKQIRLYFGACDLIVLNYMRGSASASGAAHRALASHRPICGTDDPCIQEIPKLTVSRFDKQALLRGIIKILENNKLQKELVVEAEKVARETSWQVVAGQHKEVYGIV